MSADSNVTRPSFLMRFSDAFVQERNIRLMLAIGMLILLGSSALLVTGHWQDQQYTPLWKYLTVVGYTAVAFAAGEWTRHRLGLLRTATVLQALTVLLLPVTFLVSHWAQNREASPVDQIVHLVAVGANLAFCVLAARRIFRHFLRTHQPTYELSFVLLASAGAIVPGLPVAWAPIVALALWAVFAAGSIKVNRHVFWLTEERRTPRIFGFFPILLLGAQFLALVALHAPGQIGLSWFGVGCVLTAIPVLFTADALAKVFQQRTGNLVRPLPWAIIGPLCLGVVLCVLGMVLAGTGLSAGRPQALVVAAGLSAVVMGVIGRRTGHRAFVWGMLACIMMAYNFSPAFFLGVVRMLLDHGAHLVQEQRLPIAFYGLTYLPLLFAAMTISKLRRTDQLFAGPLRQFAIGLGCLMLALGCGHVKALLPVALCMTVAFAVQSLWFRDSRLALLAVLAWLIAAGGLAPFLTTVLNFPLPPRVEYLFLAGAAMTLLVVGRIADPVLERLDERLARIRSHLFQTCSLLVSLLLSAAWLGLCVLLNETNWPISLALAVLLAIQAVWWGGTNLAGAAIVFAQTIMLLQGLLLGMSPADVVSLFTTVLCGQWLLGRLLDGRLHGRAAQAFVQANFQVCACWLSCGLVLIGMPWAVARILAPALPTSMAGQIELLLTLAWPCPWLMAAWAFAEAYRRGKPALSVLACLGFLGVIGAAFIDRMGAAGWRWLPAAWSMTALAALPMIEFMWRRIEQIESLGSDPAASARWRAVTGPATWLAAAVFGLCAFGSLLFFPLAMRLAGALGLAGLIMSALRRRQSFTWPALTLANWQMLILMVSIFVPGLKTIFDLARHDLTPLCLPVAAVSALSLLLWECWGIAAGSKWEQPLRLHRLALRFVAVTAMLGSLQLPGLTSIGSLAAVSVFLCIAVAELVAACRLQVEERVWTGLAVLGIGLGYLAWFGAIGFGHGLAMFVVLALGWLAWLFGHVLQSQDKLRILARPIQQIAFLLPVATVLIGVYRHAAAPPVWLGANSLALLMAAGFYFWRGLERKSRELLILAGLILNIALVLLWRELSWNDPQFFMIPVGISILALVQLMRAEIPERLHDPLRYLGALVILVSPTFHIVGGSWLHLMSLMLLSVLVVLTAMGLRVRALMYTGAAFLVADLAAMVVRSGIDHPSLLWLVGVTLGGLIIALAAYCERNREELVLRMRVLAEALEQWQ